jgi:hypothetical protein
LDLLHHRLNLLLVVGRLNNVGGKNQLKLGIRHRLRTVALLESATGIRHDPWRFIGAVNLTVGAWAGLRRPRSPSRGLLAGRRCLLRASSQLGLVFRLFSLESLRGTRFDLGLRYGGSEGRAIRSYSTPFARSNKKNHLRRARLVLSL